MATAKKRPSKKAKAALKAINESKLLNAKRTENESQDGQNFRNPDPSPRTAGANKQRPDKKRG
jgi:hypothetical protein